MESIFFKMRLALILLCTFVTITGRCNFVGTHNLSMTKYVYCVGHVPCKSLRLLSKFHKKPQLYCCRCCILCDDFCRWDDMHLHIHTNVFSPGGKA